MKALDFVEQTGNVSYKLVFDFDDRVKKLLRESVDRYIDFVDKIQTKYDFELSLFNKVIEEVNKGGVKCFRCGKGVLRVNRP